MRRILSLVLASAALAPMPAIAAITFTDAFAVAGEATDLSGFGSAEGANRLSFGSDLIYDAHTDTFFGMTDRGPGGGLIDFAPRINTFRLETNMSTGEIGQFLLQRTIVFTQADGVTPFTGLRPDLVAGGNAATLGASFDPEGVARRPNGNFIVADEYGPSVYEFDPDGRFIRSFETPANLAPKRSDGTTDYAAARPDIVSGRQDNRGFEGLTLSNDGTKAYAILQDPLVNEGAQDDGRRSRNLRIVEYDVATGQSTGQYIYQLDPLSEINTRTPGDTFSATNQGRSIGVSSITALPDGSFLVIERDNRGLGVDDPTGARDIGQKRVYRITLNGATDVSSISLAGSNNLPAGVVPVGKTLFLDVQALLEANGLDSVEKLEGLSFHYTANGVALYIVSDNDFSVTQTGVFGAQTDVCTSGQGGVFSQAMIGAGCPNGQSLIPSMIYRFDVTGAEVATFVPEPATWAMLIGGFGIAGGALRRRRTGAVLA